MQHIGSILVLMGLVLISCKGNTGTATRLKTEAAQFEWLFDTAKVLTREDCLAAATQLRRINERYITEKEPDERGMYYRILKARTFLHQKMYQLLDTIPVGEREPFLKQFRDLLPE